VTWLAAGLEGLDDEHGAAAAGARVRERLCLIANAYFHTAKSEAVTAWAGFADWTFWNIPPCDGFRPVTRPCRAGANWYRRTWPQLNRFRRTPRGVAFDQRPVQREPWIGQSIVLRHVV